MLDINLFHTNGWTENRVYKSATEYDYPPFSVTDGGVPDGFSVELLREVAKVMELEITFKIDHWEVIKGELDGNIFVRNDNKDIQSEEDLFSKKIIVMAGDNAHEYAKRMGFSDNIITTKTYREAFELLSSGKHDAVLAQCVVGMRLTDDLVSRIIVTQIAINNGWKNTVANDGEQAVERFN